MIPGIVDSTRSGGAVDHNAAVIGLFSPSWLGYAIQPGLDGETFQDTAGTTEASLNGQPVRRLDDFSPQNHSFQNPDADFPTLGFGGSAYWLNMGGGAQIAQIASMGAGMDNYEKATRVFAFRFNALPASGDTWMFQYGDGTASGGNWTVIINSTGQIVCHNPYGAYYTNYTFVTGVDYILSMAYDRSLPKGQEMAYRLNGVPLGQLNSTWNEHIGGLSQQRERIGDGADMRLYGALFRQDILTTEQFEVAEAWLASLLPV